MWEVFEVGLAIFEMNCLLVLQMDFSNLVPNFSFNLGTNFSH